MADAVVPYDFDESFQKKVVSLSLRDPNFLAQVEGLVRPEFFTEDVNGSIMSVLIEYQQNFKKGPHPTILKTVLEDARDRKKIRKDMMPDMVKRIQELMKPMPLADKKFITDKIAEFGKKRAVEEAVLTSADLIEKGDYAKIEKLIRAALTLGIQNEGQVYNFWDEIDNRTSERQALKSGVVKPDGITTGHKEMDDVLSELGWGRKELSVLMGAAKAGKSMSLAEFAKNASLEGFNVIYFTLEVSAKITANRIDANLSDTAMKALKDTPNAVKAKLDALRAKAGILEIREFPSGTMKPSDLRRVVQKYRDLGTVFDLIVVDYADIMAPEVYTGNRIEDSRLVYLGLRAIAQEFDAAMLTATQTNRGGAAAATATMTDIAEDFNKVRTADLLISINASPADLAAGEARLFFAAMRNSESGFTLRIKQDRSRMKFLIKVLGRE